MYYCLASYTRTLNVYMYKKQYFSDKAAPDQKYMTM